MLCVCLGILPNFTQNYLLFPVVCPTLIYSCKTGSGEGFTEDGLLEGLSQLYAEKDVSAQKAAVASVKDENAAVELREAAALALAPRLTEDNEPPPNKSKSRGRLFEPVTSLLSDKNAMMREAQKQDQLVGENMVKLQIESEKQKTELARLDVERERQNCPAKRGITSPASS